ncbi:MAG: glutamine ABC transporter ATP-binding protein GlnQ, partial [[Clostridium] hylemonae]
MTTNGETLIKVEELHKIFGELHALNGVSEEIKKGEVV